MNKEIAREIGPYLAHMQLYRSHGQPRIVGLDLLGFEKVPEHIFLMRLAL
jgi:hypothetical protein